MIWASFFRDGGWGMFPTAISGFFLVAAGALLLLRPERRFVRLLIALGLMTLGSGVLSATVGVVNTVRFVITLPPAEQLKVLLLGCAESLNCVILALMLAVLAAALASIAALRASWARAEPSA